MCVSSATKSKKIWVEVQQSFILDFLVEELDQIMVVVADVMSVAAE